MGAGPDVACALPETKKITHRINRQRLRKIEEVLALKLAISLAHNSAP